MADIAVFIKHSDVFTEKSSFQDLIALLNKFELPFLLNIFIKIDSIFSPNNYRSLEIQDFLIESLFNNRDRKLIKSIIEEFGKNGGLVFFFSRQQIENLIRLNIAYNKNTNNKNTDNAKHLLFKIFLLMNEYYDSLTPQQDDTIGTINYLIRSYLYNHAPQIRKAIVRYYKLFYELPKHFEWYQTQNWNNDIKTFTGISIEELIAFGFSFLSHSNEIRKNFHDSYSPFITKNNYLKNTILSHNKISFAFNIFCSDYLDCKSHLLEQINTSENWQLDFDYQNNFPLVEIPSVGVGLHGHRFLTNSTVQSSPARSNVAYHTGLRTLNMEAKIIYIQQ